MNPILPSEVVDEITSRLGLSKLDEEARRLYVETFMQELIETFILSLGSELTVEQKRTADEYVRAEDPQGFLEYLTKHIPDFYERLNTLLPKSK